jgi:hypothetical protein
LGELDLRDGQEHADSVFASARLVTEDELPDLLAPPYTLRKGLYHPPDPDLDQTSAEQLEVEKKSLHEDRAGFFAIRWIKGEPDSPVRGGFAALGSGNSDA